MKTKEDIYKGRVWKSVDEYYELARKFSLFGEELEKFLKKQNTKKHIKEPEIKPGKGIPR